MTKIAILDLIRGIRMKLRWKFFLILFIFSLLPLLVVLVINQHGARLTGLAISGDSNKKLTKMVGRELTQSAQNSAKMLLRIKDAMEYYLQVLGRDTEHFLAELPPEPTQIYFAEDFNDLKSAPPDFLPSRRYFIRSDGGQLIPNPVSFNHPVFFLAPQIDRKAVSEDIAKLARLVPTFKQISNEFGKKLYWTYISLQSGVHISYPGHRGFPENYDPRQRPWYKNAGRTATWSRPLIDVTTGQVIVDVAGTNRFVTMFMLEIDMLDKHLKWVRAGHIPAVIYDPRTDSFEELRGSGIPLGVEKSWVYEENKKSGLSEGQIIFLSSDGVWEQRNPDGEMFWKDRVHDLIRKNSTQSASDIINAFSNTLNRFKGDLKFEDDVTMVVIKIR